MYKQYLYSLGKSNFCSNSVGKQQLSMDDVMGKSINSNCILYLFVSIIIPIFDCIYL